MSRIGKKPVTVPAGVTVTIDGATVTVKGGKGELTRPSLRRVPRFSLPATTSPLSPTLSRVSPAPSSTTW